MKTTAFCPISNKKIDEHVARLNGAFTLLFLAVFIVTGSIIPIFFLFGDFALRSGRFSRFSPLAYLSRKIAQSVSLKPLLINAGPKIFAARIGLVFNLLIILSYLAGLYNPALVFTGIFGVCALLESAVGYCVACQVYPYVYKLTGHFKVQKVKI
ncbi:MAG: DUF4395 domain-containing protein [Bacteroidota bacterium]|nr:DUF4395 domain-containing protein [Bacteroidota bacterium]